jgi:hypothetical protein
VRVSNDEIVVLKAGLVRYQRDLTEFPHAEHRSKEELERHENAVARLHWKLNDIWTFRQDMKRQFGWVRKLRFRDFIGAIVGFILGGAAYIWWPW